MRNRPAAASKNVKRALWRLASTSNTPVASRSNISATGPPAPQPTRAASWPDAWGAKVEAVLGILPQCSSQCEDLTRRFEHVVEIAQARAWGVDQHRHVAGLVAVGAHQFVGVRNLLPREHVAHAWIDALVEHELVGGAGLLEMGEMRALHALLPHPDIARVEGDVVAGGAGAEHHHAAALDHEAGNRERRLARMLEHDVDVALAGDLPDRLAEAPRFLHPDIVFRRPDLGHRAPAFELAAVDHALGPEIEHVFHLRFIGDDADRVRARGGDELHAEHAEAARSAPDEHIVAGLEEVRRMAEQHAIGGGERERIAARLLPGKMRRLDHELARLHAAELRERAVRRFVAPDALRRRQQRIAAIAVLVVAVVLIAVNDDLVADLPALDLRAHRPDHSGGVRAGDV